MSSPQEVIATEKFEIKEVYSTLEIDEDIMEIELANNFQLFLAFGSINILFGLIALFLPISSATVVARGLAILLILVGVINCAEICSAKYYRGPAVIGGFALIVLGFLLLVYPGANFTVMTILVALVHLCGGVLRAKLARQYPEMVASKALLYSGIVSIVISIIAIITIIAIDMGAMPTRSSAAENNFAILIGVNWLAYGGQRLALGLKGRDIAEREEEAIGDDYVNVL